MADALIPLLNNAFSEKAVKAAFLRRDKKARGEAAEPALLCCTRCRCFCPVLSGG